MYSPERERYLVEYEEDDTEVGPLSALSLPGTLGRVSPGVIAPSCCPVVPDLSAVLGMARVVGDQKHPSSQVPTGPAPRKASP